MKEEDIIKTLREEAEHNIPDVRERVFSAAEKDVALPAGDVLVKSKKKWLIVAAALLLTSAILFAVIGFFLWNGGGTGGAFKIVVSINPSVEFTLDGGKVVSTRSLNKDAAVLIQGEDFTGDTAEEAALRFAELADSKHLIGADGIRIYAEGDSVTLESVHTSLARKYQQYSITDMDESAFSQLVEGYDESEMGEFEDWLAQALEGQKEQFKREIEALLESYATDLNSLDTNDRAAVEAFNQKYLRLGEDLTFEDGEESKKELLKEFSSLKNKLDRNPEKMTDELFSEFIDEIEDVYEDRFERNDNEKNDDDDNDDDDKDDDDRDDRDDE